MKIALDLDGVLVDFTKGCCKLFNFPYPDPWPPGHYQIEKVMDLTPEEFWGKINGAGPDFWAELEWMPDGLEILRMCEKAVGAQNVVISTSPSMSPASAMGKMQWIFREMTSYSRRFMIGAPKYFLAQQGTILVDDFETNLGNFMAHSGQTILVPRPWNKLNSTEALPYIQRQLQQKIR